MMEDIKNILESLLFVTKDPLTLDKLKKILPEADTNKMRESLSALSEEYENRKGGFYLKEIAGGYQLRTRPEYRDWIARLIQPNPMRLSKAALEVLAIIAYRQPIIRADVEHIRGVDSGSIIRMLLEKKLVRVLGRKDIPGRPLIYTTTKHFLEVFELKNLKDLPTPKEIEEIGELSPEDSSDSDQASSDQDNQDHEVAHVHTEEDTAEPGSDDQEHSDNKGQHRAKIVHGVLDPSQHFEMDRAEDVPGAQDISHNTDAEDPDLTKSNREDRYITQSDQKVPLLSAGSRKNSERQEAAPDNREGMDLPSENIDQKEGKKNVAPPNNEQEPE